MALLGCFNILSWLHHDFNIYMSASCVYDSRLMSCVSCEMYPTLRVLRPLRGDVFVQVVMSFPSYDTLPIRRVQQVAYTDASKPKNTSDGHLRAELEYLLIEGRTQQVMTRRRSPRQP